MITIIVQEDFEQAAEEVKHINVTNNDDLLEVYALYKQAKFGDNNTGMYACGT